jgi:hypothetical protein
MPLPTAQRRFAPRFVDNSSPTSRSYTRASKMSLVSLSPRFFSRMPPHLLRFSFFLFLKKNNSQLLFLFLILFLFLMKDNTTRFYILANHPSSPLPNTRYDGPGERNALIRLEVVQKPGAPGTPVAISDLLGALWLPVVRLDRRPSTTIPREQFGSVYFAEVIAGERSDGIPPSSQHAGLSSWRDRVLGAVARVVQSGGSADLLGTW